MEEVFRPVPFAAVGDREAVLPAPPQPVPPVEPPVTPAPPPTTTWEPPQRDEVRALLDRIDLDDLYAVLDLPADAEIPEVRAAYYNLARRFHPDRFREGPLADLHSGIETAFVRITEAYTTLSEPESRREYQMRGAPAAPQVGPNPQELAAINFRRGRELLDAGRRVDALGFLENAVRLNPEPAVYHRDLGLLQAQNPRFRQEAEESLRQALERDPSDPVARVGLGLVLRRAGKEEEATRELEETLRWNADHPAALAALGRGPVTPELRSGPLGPLFPE
jgi:tetratricopeptide (TPR) repeat protein